MMANEKRLVDANEMKNNIMEAMMCQFEKNGDQIALRLAEMMWHFIDVTESVDAVEVVRCKECKKWDCYGGEDSHKGDCSELVGLESCMYEDDFCSYGERKEDNGS